MLYPWVLPIKRFNSNPWVKLPSNGNLAKFIFCSAATVRIESTGSSAWDQRA